MGVRLGERVAVTEKLGVWVAVELGLKLGVAVQKPSSSVEPSQSSSKPLHMSLTPGCRTELESSQSRLFAT